MKNHLLLFVVLISGFLFNQSYSQENKQIKKIYKIKDFIERVDTMQLIRIKGNHYDEYDTSLVRLIPKAKIKEIDSDKYFDNLKMIRINKDIYYRELPICLKRKRSPFEIYDTVLSVIHVDRHSSER